MLFDAQFWCWVVTILLFIIGTIFSLIPLAPGCLLIFLGIVCQAVWGKAEFSAWAWAYFIGLFLFSFVADKLAGLMGAKIAGATKAGLFGTFAGMIIGAIVLTPVIGVIVGALVGAFIAELIVLRNPGKALKGGIGAALGLILGLGLDFFIALLMIISFLCYYFFL